MAPLAPGRSLCWSSDACLRVGLPGGPSTPTSMQVHSTVAALRRAGLPGLLDVVPAYDSLLLTFDLDTLDAPRVEREVAREVERVLTEGVAGDVAPAPRRPRRLEVPTCYEGDCAPDLVGLAGLLNLSPEQVIHRHLAATYTVAFLGFAPGFPYLLGLDERLAAPRLARPRLRVPGGSVAIAGAQAGIYPLDTPGGWRLIGRTSLTLFDARREPSALLAAGDEVRFTRLERDGHEQHAPAPARHP